MEQAEALGITLRVKPSGPKHAWVELEFKPEGALAKFQQVSLEISDGDELRMGWTPLKDRRTDGGRVLVRLMGGRRFLDNVTLRIVCGDLGESGLDVRLKDFVDFETLTVARVTDEVVHAAPEGADQPATVLEPSTE